ncbi:hypothetical protein Nstercoris_01155 [Nitrosomonas stercoris]|uniref:OsmC-like protein n=1 Tax=Nitrosomonas stercoris TaxID=1444684 RepID=A0A4Y1YLJ5_9PROT|nr:hypothetical protein Nstercoris_01155 [Nitrosomonas stercoris]
MTSSSTKNMVNGINIEQSFVIQKQIREDREGEIAKPKYQTTVTWNDGYHTTANVTDGQTVTGDEPPRYGGGGMGLSPQDLLLTAVGHCLTASYIGGLSAARINVKSLKLHVSGRVNFGVAYAVETGYPGFEDINVVVEIETDVPQEEVTALLEKLKATAPIPDTIMRPVPVNIEIRHPSK